MNVGKKRINSLLMPLTLNAVNFRTTVNGYRLMKLKWEKLLTVNIFHR